MEIRKYAELKAAGAATLVRVNEHDFQVQLRRYDPETGRPTDPEIVSLNREAIEHAITQHEQVLIDTPLEIAGIKGVLVEMDALNAAAPVDEPAAGGAAAAVE